LACKVIPTEYKDANIKLKITGKGSNYSFYVSYNGTDWVTVAEDADAHNLSTQDAGGFTGTLIGPYASSALQPDKEK